MSSVDQFRYLAPTLPLAQWLQSANDASFAPLVGAPGPTARVFAADPPPAGCPTPYLWLHPMPGGSVDYTVMTVQLQFDCVASSPDEAEALALALASLLASTPPRTRIGPQLTFEGPGQILSSFYLPIGTSRVPRQILLARLSFASY